MQIFPGQVLPFTALFLELLYDLGPLLPFAQSKKLVIDIGKVPHEASRSIVANFAKLQQWVMTSKGLQVSSQGLKVFTPLLTGIIIGGHDSHN